MVDILQQIANWRDGASEESQVATELLDPDTTFPVPSPSDAEAHHRKAHEVFQWLIRQL